MSNYKLFQLKNILTVGLLAILAGLIAFSVSVWTTPRYKSTFKLLTVFNQANIDTYTASKTANYITGIMGEVVYSDSFISTVYASSGIKDDLGYGSESRLRQWKKTVKTKVLDNKGMMVIDVYGNDKMKTNALANAIAMVIINNHGNYDGSADRATIKMIDQPAIFESWSLTKIIEDSALGVIVGLLLGFTFIVIFPNHRLFESAPKKKYLYPPVATEPINSGQSLPAIEPAREEPTKEQKNDLPQRPGNSFTPPATSNEWLKDYYNNNQL
ncbi:MAG: hypothetical protein WC473_05020 [Patescibacteria group bacterium]|jgi:capsular polysaccharide biosynthesis protein